MFLPANDGSFRGLTKPEEATLARKMKRGCVASQQKLIVSILPWIVNLAGRYARSSEQLDEFISLGNLQICRVINRFDPKKGRLSTFVAICLKRLYWDELNRAKPPHRTGLELDCRPGRPEMSPAEAAHRTQRVQDVSGAVDRLPPRERYIVERRMIDHTLEEIGGDLGVTRSRIGQIEKRAMDRLRLSLMRRRV